MSEERRQIQVPVTPVAMGTFIKAIHNAGDRIEAKRYEVHNGYLICMVLFRDEGGPIVYRLTDQLQYPW